MPAKKYHTEEERLEARRASGRAHMAKYNRENKELLATKARLYYWSNDNYRNAKLDRLADRYRSNDDGYRERTLLAATHRYWNKRSETLGKGNAIEDSNAIEEGEAVEKPKAVENPNP